MTDSGEFDARPVRAFLPGPDVRVDETAWPAGVPALAQVLRDGLEVPAGLTVLVGENGSGKSTVVETLAEAYGLNPQGGSAMGQSFRIRPSEPGGGAGLTVVRGARPRWSGPSWSWPPTPPSSRPSPERTCLSSARGASGPRPGKTSAWW